MLPALASRICTSTRGCYAPPSRAQVQTPEPLIDRTVGGSSCTGLSGTHRDRGGSFTQPPTLRRSLTSGGIRDSFGSSGDLSPGPGLSSRHSFSSAGRSTSFALSHGNGESPTDVSLVDIGDEAGRTPLMLAATYDALPLILRLLAAGAQINKTMDDGTTAIMYCCRLGRAAIVRSLWEHRADVFHITESKGSLLWRSALEVAARNGRIECINTLASLVGSSAQVRHRSPICYLAVCTGCLPPPDACSSGELTARLLRQWAQEAWVNRAAAVSGETPLMRAARAGAADACHRPRHLSYPRPTHAHAHAYVRAHAHARSPVPAHRRAGEADTTRRLLELRADPMRHSLQGESALLAACTNGFDQVVVMCMCM